MAESTARTTTAVMVPRLGGADVLEVGPWEVLSPGADEVRIVVEAAGVSYADLLVMQGVHPERRTPPFVPGWDVVGEVESAGSNVTHVSVGDRVAGLSIVGGWAGLVVVPGVRVVAVPHPVDATAAVCLVMDYVVAFQMLTRSARVLEGDTILVQGAGGGVGTAIMQVARTLGVQVLGTDREGKRSHVEASGATLIDFETEDVVQRCRDLTAGRGVEAAFDGVGTTATSSLKAARRGGTVVWFGMISFLTDGRRDARKIATTVATVLPVFATNLAPGGKRTKLYSIQHHARQHPEHYQQDLATLLDMLTAGTISPQVAAVWELEEVPAAVEALAKAALPGKQVISPLEK